MQAVAGATGSLVRVNPGLKHRDVRLWRRRLSKGDAVLDPDHHSLDRLDVAPFMEKGAVAGRMQVL